MSRSPELTSLQRLHKLTPLMVGILGQLNADEPLSGYELARRLEKSVQGVGVALSGLHARALVRIHEYGVGASCRWRTVKAGEGARG